METAPRYSCHCHLSPKGALSFKTLVLYLCQDCNCSTYPTYMIIMRLTHKHVLLSTWCKQYQLKFSLLLTNLLSTGISYFK